MSDLEPHSPGGALTTAGAELMDYVKYGIVRAQLMFAGARLRGLSAQIRSTYRYVEGCSRDVDRLAEQMAGLQVDVDTVGEHRQAALLMRHALGTAELMAGATEDLSTLFELTAADHEADYGSVAEAARNMPVPMANAEFYSNR
jgi:hypothetical protein